MPQICGDIIFVINDRRNEDAKSFLPHAVFALEFRNNDQKLLPGCKFVYL